MYLLEPDAPETISNGLTELLTLDREGYFLSLERTFGFTGAGAKIFQVVAGNASDTYTIDSLKNISMYNLCINNYFWIWKIWVFTSIILKE